MENDKIAKRIYVREFAGSCLIGMLWKRWIDTVKGCLKKTGLDVGQERRMVYEGGVCERECIGDCLRDEPLTLTKC